MESKFGSRIFEQGKAICDPERLLPFSHGISFFYFRPFCINQTFNFFQQRLEVSQIDRHFLDCYSNILSKNKMSMMLKRYIHCFYKNFLSNFTIKNGKSSKLFSNITYQQCNLTSFLLIQEKSKVTIYFWIFAIS